MFASEEPTETAPAAPASALPPPPPPAPSPALASAPAPASAPVSAPAPAPTSEAAAKSAWLARQDAPAGVPPSPAWGVAPAVPLGGETTRDSAHTVQPGDGPPSGDGKGFGGGEATRDPAPTYIDPNDPKGKQQAIHKAESFSEYLARRSGGSGGGGVTPAAAASTLKHTRPPRPHEKL